MHHLLYPIRIAVLIPCYNEAVAIANVVNDFRNAIPGSNIYVYDNGSNDNTADIACAAGAVVGHVSRRGKGYVVRQMFADIDADVYLLVDGDGTYDKTYAPRMVDELITRGLDMVVATRVASDKTAYPAGHRFGNVMLNRILSFIFGETFTDILSGYRALSRRFVKSFPAFAKGFETETELSIHALELAMPIGEVEAPYFPRQDGSVSKLRTYKDGFRILFTIMKLFETEKPMQFFSLVTAMLAALSLTLFYPIFIEYLETGLVPRFPTAILSTGIMILAFFSLTCGLILDTVTRGRRELKRLIYLSIPFYNRER